MIDNTFLGGIIHKYKFLLLEQSMNIRQERALGVRQGHAVSIGICPVPYFSFLFFQQSSVTAHLHQLYQESVLLPPTANHLPFQLLAKCSDQLLITVHFDYLVTAYSVPLVRFMSNGCCP